MLNIAPPHRYIHNKASGIGCPLPLNVSICFLLYACELLSWNLSWNRSLGGVIRRLSRRWELPKEEVNNGKGDLVSAFHPAPWTELEAQQLQREEGQKVKGAVQEKPFMTVHSRAVSVSKWQMAEPGTSWRPRRLEAWSIWSQPLGKNLITLCWQMSIKLPKWESPENGHGKGGYF